MVDKAARKRIPDWQISGLPMKKTLETETAH
jgi:hypothetical protein